jgi:hypothetical protein
MSLADVAKEIQGRPEKKPDPVQQLDFEHELTGKVAEDGTIVLDTTDLDAVGARLKAVRQLAARCKKEDDRLRKLILAHPSSKPGYRNLSIEIEGSQQMRTDNPELLAALMKAKLFGAACNMSLSPPKIRELAVKHPKIAAAIKHAEVRKIKSTK